MQSAPSSSPYWSSQQSGQLHSVVSPVATANVDSSDSVAHDFFPSHQEGAANQCASNIFYRPRFPSSTASSRRSTRRSTPRSQLSSDFSAAAAATDVVLVGTRPLLKALARRCRPFPPWCVGFGVPNDMTTEMQLFSSFLRPTPTEQSCNESAIRAATDVLQNVWPSASLRPIAATAAGLPMFKDITLHYYVVGTEQSGAEEHDIHSRVQEVANAAGMQVEFCNDYRGATCVLLSDARTGVRLNVRYGSEAPRAEAASSVFATILASNESNRAVYILLDALLRQNKILDDTGTKTEMLNGEALATMLVAVINSYDVDDTPDSGRLLMDFFLTYGFSANFDITKNSVTIKGMREATYKVHANAALSVLDPSNETRNLTSHLQKAAHLQAVFNYCYTALSQFAQVLRHQQRAQSTLSTIIGGEAYWGRVLQLYHEGISPFVEVVSSKKHMLIRAL
ncbi:hypothetical protein ERJ75_000729100 [Trypanosoma vivax]|uniref:Uncharacterized protein n=1 Tax=Trypanosoma vivax (strain Y486) TaxID=1055687 RepID=G0TX48_TRYVY|nr:hypothetical protein ERJ75_000729100 [Trypanosoma vivax]CCC48538.1 conserved hypothetical protein [Trypanosoma vivax Y486]